ncbi:hypothetical protein FOCC_FOCC015479 [Frankliniella occidentalis]|nr:hypothetical protein FOCC_FOCC015479 [Frankliniella occidentalis]
MVLKDGLSVKKGEKVCVILMQVATLFRESSQILETTAEAHREPGKHSPKQLSLSSYDTMKQESHDDGYETCGDLDSRGLGKDFHNHSHALGHSLSEMDHLQQPKTESKAYYQPPSELSQTSKDHKFIDYPSDMQQVGKENKFIDYQSSGSGFGMKCNNMSGVDPYSFSEDVSMGAGSLGRGPESGMSALPQSVVPPVPGHGMIPQQPQCGGTFPPIPKKRGRKKKIRPGEEGADGQFFDATGGKGEKVGHFKERKKHDRFNGMTEEEVQKRTLPDHLTPNLDIIIVSTILAHRHIRQHVRDHVRDHVLAGL